MNTCWRTSWRPDWKTATLICTLTVALASLCASATAASVSTAAFSGTTLDGRSYTSANRPGRVQMVVLWRTDCAVCLSKMPELRANAVGWKDKPFDLLTVSLDASSADTESYDRTRRQISPQAMPMWSFWHGQVQMPADWRGSGRLPVTLVFDRQGRLAARHEGRVPADVWDQVADLLP